MIVRFSAAFLAAVLVVGQTSTVLGALGALGAAKQEDGMSSHVHSQQHSQQQQHHLRATHSKSKGETDDAVDEHDDEEYPEDDDFHPEGSDDEHDDEQYPDDDAYPNLNVEGQRQKLKLKEKLKEKERLVSLPGEYQSFKEEFNLHPDTILDLYDLTSTEAGAEAETGAETGAETETETETKAGSYNAVLAIRHKDYTIDFVLSEDSFQPMDIYTEDATYTKDGEELNNGSGSGLQLRPNVYFKRHGTDGIIVTMNHDGPHHEIKFNGSSSSNSSTSSSNSSSLFLNVNNIQNIQIMGQDGGDTQLHSVAPGIFAEIKPEDFDPDYVALLKTLEMKKSVIPPQEDMSKTSLNFDATPQTTASVESRQRQRHHQRQRQLQTQCAQYDVLEVAIVYDSTLCAQQGGHAQAKNRIEAVVAKSSFMYQRQNVCAKIKMSSIEGHCSSASDPYRGGIHTGTIGCNTQNVGVLNYFQQYWKANKFSRHRDIAHIFFARNFGENTIGCAFMNVLCNKSWGYGANNFSYSSNTYQLAALFAHEAGHNVGLEHVPSTHNDPFVMGSHIGQGEHVWCTASRTVLVTNIPKAQCTSTETTGNTCQDTPVGWHDADGSAYNCNWYAMGNNCADYGHGWRYNGKNAGEACCACGGGKALALDMGIDTGIDSVDEHEKEEEKNHGDNQRQGYGEISCGCPSSCTSDILETFVDDKTIAEHISWIVDNLGESEFDACELVCGEEYDEICGDACNPSQCSKKLK